MLRPAAPTRVRHAVRDFGDRCHCGTGIREPGKMLLQPVAAVSSAASNVVASGVSMTELRLQGRWGRHLQDPLERPSVLAYQVTAFDN